MFKWLTDRLDVSLLAVERADRLQEENKTLRELVAAHEKENDRLNKVIDQITNVVNSWKQ